MGIFHGIKKPFGFMGLLPSVMIQPARHMLLCLNTEHGTLHFLQRSLMMAGADEAGHVCFAVSVQIDR